MMEIFNEIKQGTDQWKEIRSGIPTASMFKAIIAKGEGKTRKAYLNRLAAEIITGESIESFTSQAMQRGTQMEDEARSFYCFLKDVETTQVGFIKNGRKGASPDSLIGIDGLLEIKTQRGDLLVETILKDEFPPEHMAQVQGQLWVSEREWCDLIVYWPNMPQFIKRIYRDESYINRLTQEIDRFNEELDKVVSKINSYGRNN